MSRPTARLFHGLWQTSCLINLFNPLSTKQVRQIAHDLLLRQAVQLLQLPLHIAYLDCGPFLAGPTGRVVISVVEVLQHLTTDFVVWVPRDPGHADRLATKGA